MTNHAVLNNVTHKDVKIRTERSAEYGDAVASVLTFPFEFRSMLAYYPICFRKDDASGEFYAAALLGFEENENLFLSDEGWNATYIPLVLEREPFLIGFQHSQDPTSSEPQRVINIDMDSPRVNTQEGEPVFKPMGGNTPYLERVGSILEAIYQGQSESKLFFDMLNEKNLLEPIELDIQLKDGSDNKLVGFYTVHEENLRNLPAEDLATLNKAGVLEHAYMAIASLSNFGALIDLKNRRL